MDKNKLILAIDVGGTFIKGGVINSKGEILFKSKVATSVKKVDFDLAQEIFKLADSLSKQSQTLLSDFCGIGIALPGLIDSKKGILCHSGNLGLSYYPIIKKLTKFTNIPIKISNDADLATLAELKFGAGQKYNDFIFMTIGTGIGGGVIINGAPLSNSINFSGEFGHMKITDSSIKCSCGEYGCFEALASTKALTEQVKNGVIANPSSKMAKETAFEEINGETIFNFIGKDTLANEVFSNWISYLGSGIVNLVNAFGINKVLLGGAISAQKTKLTKPLEDYVNSHIYAKNAGVKVQIKTATLSGDAGLLGAASLFLN